jgi:hypothetical protein
MLLWLLTSALLVASIELFPHRNVNFASLLNFIIQALLFFISLFLFLREPIKKNKYIFLNFTLFFAVSTFAAHIYRFAGVSIFTGFKYATVLYYEYLLAAYIVTLSTSVLFLVIDLLFHDFSVLKKYAITLVGVFFFFGYYYYPIVKDPMYVYSTEEIQQWKTLATSVPQGGEIPSAEELAENVTLQAWKNGNPVGNLYPAEEMKRVEELIPYLEGNNYVTLLFQPIHESMISMNVVLIAFMLLYFGYQYKKDPPQGAYVDKIMFSFLLFVSTEILHFWGYIKSVELQSFVELFNVGQYITSAILLFMVLFFSLRLRFISSVQGEFYETEIVTNPEYVSRWRDWLDNIVLAKFSNLKFHTERLFEQPSTIKKGENI